MQRSARTAHTIRPSRSGSSTMQPATGHAAWQIEQANAPKQRSGSITAMVFGAFLRGPDIILVHIYIWTVIISESTQGMARGRRASLRHHRPERRDVLEDRALRVGREEARDPASRRSGIRSGSEGSSGGPGGKTVTGSRRAGKSRRFQLNRVAALVDDVRRSQAAADERLVTAGRRSAERRQVRRVEAVSTGQGVSKLRAVNGPH